MKVKKLVIALSLGLTFQALLPHLSSALDIDVFATIDGLRCNGSGGDPRLPMPLSCGHFPGAFPIHSQHRAGEQLRHALR